MRKSFAFKVSDVEQIDSSMEQKQHCQLTVGKNVVIQTNALLIFCNYSNKIQVSMQKTFL